LTFSLKQQSEDQSEDQSKASKTAQRKEKKKKRQTMLFLSLTTTSKQTSSKQIKISEDQRSIKQVTGHPQDQGDKRRREKQVS